MNQYWLKCNCGCGGLTIPDANVVVWPPNRGLLKIETRLLIPGFAARVKDPTRARAEIYRGAQFLDGAEFDTLEEAQAWAVALARLEGVAP